MRILVIIVSTINVLLFFPGSLQAQRKLCTQLNLIICIDVSKSIDETRRNEIQQTLSSILRKIHDNDDIHIVIFAEKAMELFKGKRSEINRNSFKLHLKGKVQPESLAYKDLIEEVNFPRPSSGSDNPDYVYFTHLKTDLVELVEELNLITPIQIEANPGINYGIIILSDMYQDAINLRNQNFETFKDNLRRLRNLNGCVYPSRISLLIEREIYVIKLEGRSEQSHRPFLNDMGKPLTETQIKNELKQIIGQNNFAPTHEIELLFKRLREVKKLEISPNKGLYNVVFSDENESDIELSLRIKSNFRDDIKLPYEIKIADRIQSTGVLDICAANHAGNPVIPYSLEKFKFNPPQRILLGYRDSKQFQACVHFDIIKNGKYIFLKSIKEVNNDTVITSDKTVRVDLETTSINQLVHLTFDVPDWGEKQKPVCVLKKINNDLDGDFDIFFDNHSNVDLFVEPVINTQIKKAFVGIEVDPPLIKPLLSPNSKVKIKIKNKTLQDGIFPYKKSCSIFFRYFDFSSGTWLGNALSKNESSNIGSDRMYYNFDIVVQGLLCNGLPNVEKWGLWFIIPFVLCMVVYIIQKHHLFNKIRKGFIWMCIIYVLLFLIMVLKFNYIFGTLAPGNISLIRIGNVLSLITLVYLVTKDNVVDKNEPATFLYISGLIVPIIEIIGYILDK